MFVSFKGEAAVGDGEEGETVDSGRPGSPKAQAQAKREKEEEKMTKIQRIIKKEQEVS